MAWFEKANRLARSECCYWTEPEFDGTYPPNFVADEAIEAATPHIAKAAQVRILREKAAICQKEARVAYTRLTRHRWEFMEMWLNNEADGLEAGGE